MKQKTFYDGDFNVKKLDLDKIIKFEFNYLILKNH